MFPQHRIRLFNQSYLQIYLRFFIFNVHNLSSNHRYHNCPFKLFWYPRIVGHCILYWIEFNLFVSFGYTPIWLGCAEHYAAFLAPHRHLVVRFLRAIQTPAWLLLWLQQSWYRGNHWVFHQYFDEYLLYVEVLFRICLRIDYWHLLCCLEIHQLPFDCLVFVQAIKMHWIWDSNGLNLPGLHPWTRSYQAHQFYQILISFHPFRCQVGAKND